MAQNKSAAIMKSHFELFIAVQGTEVLFEALVFLVHDVFAQRVVIFVLKLFVLIFDRQVLNESKILNFCILTIMLIKLITLIIHIKCPKS